MTRFLDLLKKSRFGQALKRLRRVQGNVDGCENGEITGWAAGRTGEHLIVGVYTSSGLITQGTANIFRRDLLEAGIGRGDHGYCISLTKNMLKVIAQHGGRVRLRTVGKPVVELGQLSIDTANRVVATGNAAAAEIVEGPTIERAPQIPSKTKTSADPLDQLIYGDLEALINLAQVATNRPPSDSVPAFRPHQKMFDTRDYIEEGSLPAPMMAYAEYVRYRYKLDTPFPFHEDVENVAHFLNWYIAGYGPLRKGLRTPMSADMIDWLNKPIVIGGVRQSLTQVTWSFLMGIPPILHSMDFNNPDWVLWAVYWWSVDQAKALHCEDCLVPDSYASLLVACPSGQTDEDWPLSQFMIRKHAQTQGLSHLDMGRSGDRKTLTLALMAMTAHRPDYLRYLPATSIDAALEPQKGGSTLLADFVGRLAPRDDQLVLDRDTFAALLRLRGFDLDKRTFVTVSEAGHRFEAAMLPSVETEEIADIQLIGPFEKASGLGQATRLSQAVLEEAGFDVNPVNFGLDNPAPEGFSKTGKMSDWKRAKVNLIHLNAESIPLVYSYAPDVFSDAYNIGYFYWELDTPAACHFLGMDLLDEIWVSTEYGVEIFGPANEGRPVTNVGMCYEDLPDLDRDDSRAFVCDRFGFKGDEFVFLVAFDSFSFIQRKNPIGTLKAFAKAFDGVDDVRLVIKTQNRTKVTDPVQQKIWEEVDALLVGDDRIFILDETLVYDDLLRLKKGSDCYISLHKSEGWGFGMIEAMNLKVPVVATGYSGNMDFCSAERVWLVDFEEVPLEQDDYIFVREGQKWAEPDIDDAARQLHAVYSDDATRKAKATAAHAFVQSEFSVSAIARRYGARLQTIFKEL